ncbi:hypothetical protein [Flavobacterium luteum]|uniref:Uncharacterized protein n=1 Tax=Flavobacterium luteum TaxID=2026654 RepID=A0A7J5AM84_9FLAO|nr:hypothetical protein [Flavobacterium luteum]KAB1158099.1 hypothetical protein F6464_03185 [Flavobacterium luteum]
MSISTIIELEDWMVENCMNNKITPGNRFETDDGVGLEKYGNLYIWYHSERGEKENLNYFNTEKEAVEFIYEYVRKDKYANSHLVGNFKDQNLKNEIIAEFTNRNIKYWNDEISYLSFNLYRFFVYRCDIEKVADLKEKYLMEK